MKKYAQNLTEKIISEHLVRGRMETGTEIFLKVDSTLVHDMSGTLAYIGFEAMGIDKIQVPAAVTFQDHNLVAMDHRSLDDHRFVASAAQALRFHTVQGWKRHLPQRVLQPHRPPRHRAGRGGQPQRHGRSAGDAGGGPGRPGRQRHHGRGAHGA